MAWFSRISALEPFHWWLIVLIPIVPPKPQPFLIAYKINSKLRSSLADKASYDLTFIFAWFFFSNILFHYNWNKLVCILRGPISTPSGFELSTHTFPATWPPATHMSSWQSAFFSARPKVIFLKKGSVLSTKGSCISALLQTPTVLFLDRRCVYIYIFYTSTELLTPL